jgi:hypothetical protein
MKSLLQTLGIVVTSTALSGLISGEAQAYNLVPQAEGEIEVGLGCLTGSCLATPGFTVTSLVDASTLAKSRLFVDDLSTESTYGAISFLAGDAGTVPTGYWFRPSEISEESGQLEVGTFKFDFAELISNLTVDYFDVEKKASGSKGTQVLEINGVSTVGSFVVPKGKNGNIYSQSFENVTSIVIAFGQDYGDGTGDGVDFQMSTPEPVSILGFGAMAIVGLLGSKKKAIN